MTDQVAPLEDRPGMFKCERLNATMPIRSCLARREIAREGTVSYQARELGVTPDLKCLECKQGEENEKTMPPEESSPRKRCTKCKGIKPLDEFPPHNNSKDGRHWWCRECVNLENERKRKAMRKYRTETRAQPQPPARAPTEKRCSKCGETRPVAEFHKNRSAPDGLNYWCKPCTCADKRERHHKKRGVAATKPRKPVSAVKPEKEKLMPHTATKDLPTPLPASVTIDFSRAPEAYTWLMERANEEFRDLPSQVLWELVGLARASDDVEAAVLIHAGRDVATVALNSKE